MLRIHVLYIFATVIATILYIVWINFGSGISFSEVFVPKVVKEITYITETTHVSKATEQSKEQVQRVTKFLSCDYKMNDLEDMIESITRALEFLRLYLTSLVVDAAVGTRVLQGQLQLILKSFSLPSEIRRQMEQLLINTTSISDDIVKHFVDKVTENQQTSSGEQRLQQNLHWIEGGTLWEMPAAGDWQRKEDLQLWRYKAVDDNTILFSQIDFSDECIGSIFEDCAVPDECFTQFLEKRRSEYYITHAILFLLFSKKKNCFNNKEYMDNITKLGNPTDIMASFCAKIMYEAKYIEENGFIVGLRDLFTEQVLVCSMAGFAEFLQPSWFRTILSWQSKELLGCFELPKGNNSKSFDQIYRVQKKSNRRKRYDYIFSAGTQSCSTHFTGVGVACMGLHLRYFLETCSDFFIKSS